MSVEIIDGKLWFIPEWKIAHTLDLKIIDREIEQEKMLFSCDLTSLFILCPAGSMIWNFAKKVVELSECTDWIIDSRVHMLMNGWYPCIPGWHTDFVPRKAPLNQPDFMHPTNTAEHYLMVVGNTSLTQFVDEPIELPGAPVGSTYYGFWNDEIKKLDPKIKTVESGEIIHFTSNDWHRGVVAKKSAWRLFVRATRGVDREPENKVRRQTQVYLPAVEGGW